MLARPKAVRVQMVCDPEAIRHCCRTKHVTAIRTAKRLLGR
jgi:hypothetical protein